MTEDRDVLGMRTRREVLGDAHVDKAMSESDSFTSDFQELVTRQAWGDIWSRPELDRRARSCITLALLSALGYDEELPMHIRAAKRHGVTTDEIKEILLHVAVYAGWPRTRRAFQIAAEELER